MDWLAIESLSAIDLVRFRSHGSIIYRRLRISGRITRSLLVLLGLRMPILRRLEIGALQHATGLRQEAYEAAEQSVVDLGCRTWLDRVRNIFDGLDVELLVEKLFFEARYDSYLFCRLCMQLALENPKRIIHCVLDDPDDTFIKKLEQRNVPKLQILVRKSNSILWYVGSILALPLLLIFHLIRYVRRRTLDGTGLIICSVDDPSSLQMMEDIFNKESNVRYAIEPQYYSSFRQNHPISLFALKFSSWNRYLKLLPAYVLATLREWRTLQGLGTLPFYFFHLLLKAEAITPTGMCMCVITTGHLTLERSARNELLRIRGSASINISKNSYVTYRQFPAEWKMNYNVFAAAGQHALDLYQNKHSLSSLILTGCYDVHRPTMGDTEAALMRQRTLNKIQSGAKLVVILSPGVCDETLSHELRLMLLATRVAQLPNTRVIVRRKPGELATGYETFYTNALHSAPEVLVTTEEFDLFDFIGPTDLFVTSISTSACDIALRGGKVLFIDFMQTPDIYIPWIKFPSIVSSEATALENIEAYLAESLERSCDSGIAQVNKKFAEYIGCKFEGFSEYRTHLQLQLAPWLASASTPLTYDKFH